MRPQRLVLVFLLTISLLGESKRESQLASENRSQFVEIQALRAKLEALIAQLARASITAAKSKSEADASKTQNAALKEDRRALKEDGRKLAVANARQQAEHNNDAVVAQEGIDTSNDLGSDNKVSIGRVEKLVNHVEQRLRIQTIILVTFMSGLYTFQIIATFVKTRWRKKGGTPLMVDGGRHDAY